MRGHARAQLWNTFSKHAPTINAYLPSRARRRAAAGPVPQAAAGCGDSGRARKEASFPQERLLPDQLRGTSRPMHFWMWAQITCCNYGEETCCALVPGLPAPTHFCLYSDCKYIMNANAERFAVGIVPTVLLYPSLWDCRCYSPGSTLRVCYCSFNIHEGFVAAFLKRSTSYLRSSGGGINFPLY